MQLKCSLESKKLCLNLCFVSKENKSTESPIQFEICLYVQILTSKKQMDHYGVDAIDSAKLRGHKRSYCKLREMDEKSVCMAEHTQIKHILHSKPWFCCEVLCTIHQHKHIERDF